MSTTFLISLLVLMISTAFILILQKTFINLIPLSTKTINKSPTFIIAGPSFSGKTSLFNALTTDEFKYTLMSQDINVANNYMLPSVTKSAKFKLMEFPGHIKLRYKLLNTIKDSVYLKGLIFMVDSTMDPPKLAEAAEFLHEILIITERRPGGIDILIACNKSESFASRPALKIKEALEKEISKILIRKAKNVKEMSNEDNGDNSLEVTSKGVFEFGLLDGSVDSLEGSVLKKDIEKWECWIDERSVN